MEKVLIVIVALMLPLIVFTMPDFDMPSWYHLAVGMTALALAVWGLANWKHSFGPTGVLIGFSIAGICFSIHFGLAWIR